jgi:hypothetical protein
LHCRCREAAPKIDPGSGARQLHPTGRGNR